jgi:hypothetical protein
VKRFFSFEKKKNQTAEPLDRPILTGSVPVYAVFSGSFVERFCTLTGPDIGPVHGSTGSTGRF